MIELLLSKMLAKNISDAPVLWLFYIVGFFCLVCFIGMGIKAFATTIFMALFGLTLSIISFISILSTLRFYKKHIFSKSEQIDCI